VVRETHSENADEKESRKGASKQEGCQCLHNLGTTLCLLVVGYVGAVESQDFQVYDIFAPNLQAFQGNVRNNRPPPSPSSNTPKFPSDYQTSFPNPNHGHKLPPSWGSPHGTIKSGLDSRNLPPSSCLIFAEITIDVTTFCEKTIDLADLQFNNK